MNTLPNYIPEQDDLEVANLNIDTYIYETANIIAEKIIESPDNLTETAFHYFRKLLTDPNSPISNNEKLIKQLIRPELNKFNDKLKAEFSIDDTNNQNLVQSLVKLLQERIISAITPEITDTKGATIYLFITTPNPDLTLTMTIGNIIKSEFDILIQSIQKAHKLLCINQNQIEANELIIEFVKNQFTKNYADILDQLKYSSVKQTEFGGEIHIVPKPPKPTDKGPIPIQNSIIITDPTLSEKSQLHTLIANATILATRSQKNQQVDYYKLVDIYVSLAIIYHNQKNPKLASDAINTAKKWATKFSITHPALKTLHKDLSLLNPTEIGLRLPPRKERRPATITSLTYSVPPKPTKKSPESPTTISPTIKKLILAASITALGVSIAKTANTPAEPPTINSVAKDIASTTPIPPVTTPTITEAISDNTPPTPPVDDISFTLAETDIKDTPTLTIAHKGLIPALKETYGLTALQLGKLYRHPSIFKGTQSFANFLKIIAEANIEQFTGVDLNSMPALITRFEKLKTPIVIPQSIIDLIEEVKNNETFPSAVPNQTDAQIEAIQQKQHKATPKETVQDTSIETDEGWFDINIDPVSPAPKVATQPSTIENIFDQTEQEIQDTIASTSFNLAPENTTTTAETDEEWNTFDATARMDEIAQASTPTLPAIPKAKGFWGKVKSLFG